MERFRVDMDSGYELVRDDACATEKFNTWGET